MQIRSTGQRLALAALALGMGAAAVGCASGSGGKKVGLRAGTGGPVPAATAGASTPAAVGAPTNGPVPTAAGLGGQPASGATTGVPLPGATTGTTRGAGPAPTSPTTGTKATTPVASGPDPAMPGTYTYRLVSGASVLTTGTTSTTLAVAPQSTLAVSGSGGQQQWVNSSSTSNVVFNRSGVFLLSETVPLANQTCTFNTPVAWPPWPVAVGKAFSGQAGCGSGPSAAILTLHGQVTGTAAVHLDDGTNLSTFVVQSKLTLSGTTLVVVETDLYAPSLRLPVQTTLGVTGGVSGLSIVSATVYKLTSSRPA